MTFRLLPLFLIACGPSPDEGKAVDTPDVDDTDVVDTTNDVDTTDSVDTDAADTVDTPDTDLPPETDVPPRVSTATYTSDGTIYCLGPSLRTEARFDTRVARVSESEIKYVAGGGLAAVDVDGDELVEIFAARQDELLLFRDQGDGRYVASQMLEYDHSDRDGIFGVSAADYDGDADLDLYVTNYPGTNWLLQNDGAGNFTDVAEAAGVAGPASHHSASSSWADFDLDGDLDLLVAGHGHVVEDGTVEVVDFQPADPTILFQNNGDGTFTDRTDLIPAGSQGAYTFNATFQDFNDDGYPEIYFANDFAGQREPSTCLNNDHGVFSALGADPALSVHIVGMGLGVGDLNNDAVPDLFLPGWRTMGVLVSGGGTWFEQSQITGIAANDARGQGMAWGSEFGDLDNDGDLDAVVNFGFLDTVFARNELEQPSAVFIQDSPMVFTDRGGEWGLAQRDAARGLVVTDVNNDGFLDVMKAGVDDQLSVSRSRCGDRFWLRVRLDQPGMNRFGIGAKVQVVDTNGGVTTRWLRAGGTGYGSGGPPEVHFGLSGEAMAAEVRVVWPDGGRDVIYDVPGKQTITVLRP